MNETLKKLKTAGAAIAIGGASLVAGSQVGKPACDYVLKDNQQETCMTTAQAEAVLGNLKGNNAGFGQTQFQDINIIKK